MHRHRGLCGTSRSKEACVPSLSMDRIRSAAGRRGRSEAAEEEYIAQGLTADDYEIPKWMA